MQVCWQCILCFYLSESILNSPLFKFYFLIFIFYFYEYFCWVGEFWSIWSAILFFVSLKVTCFPSFATFKIFSLSLASNNFIMVCLGVIYFVFIPLGAQRDSPVCVFHQFWKIQAFFFFCFYIYPNLSLYSLSNFNSTSILHLLIVFCMLLILFFPHATVWIFARDMCSTSLILFSACV